ncbi:MAG TPA: protein kinase [Isosphaeraceae bacterium]|jgi:WD40 repeat protein/tRNA A-37 threonylcarbamoyl transferase component Bud32|nr:protein kinase [Isosphaeraceae bacterium]
MTEPESQETIAEEPPRGSDFVTEPAYHEGTTLVQRGDPSATIAYPPPAQPAALAGASTLLPGYVIIEELGRGGMGVVYKARQLGLNRLVALKMILAGAHASAEVVARFRAEAEAVASLQHPNIVQIYEIGEQEGKPYFSLEYVEGGNLAERLKGAPQPARQAARLVEILARTVQAAHQRGIVHRDLKPVNVLLTPEGVPKIADFGLAKRLDGVQGQTESGSILGSPSYMAPEQAEGKAKEVGPEADVYALGAMLYELLTGRPPFRAETAIQTMKQVVDVEPVAPSRLQPGLPRDIETICLKCLQKEPARRYASAEALAEDLRRFQTDEPIVARPIGFVERLIRWCRRNPSLATLGTSVFLLLMIVAVGATIAAVRLNIARHTISVAFDQAQTEAKHAKEQTAIAERERGRADKEARDLEDQLYLHRIMLAHDQWQSNQISRTEALLAACPPALRNWAWYYLMRQCHADLKTLRGHTGAVPASALSPDGKRMASGGVDGSIRLWDMQTGVSVRTLSGHSWVVTSLAFSPDGTRLVSSSLDQTMRLWDPASGEMIQSISNPAMPVRAVAFSPRGDLIASGAGDDQRGLGELRLWDAGNGKPKKSFRSPGGLINAVAFSPDGQSLASGGTDSHVRIWSLSTGKTTNVFSGHSGPVHALAFFPDSKRLVSGGEDATVRLWDLVEGELSDELNGHLGPVLGLAVGPRNDQIASASADGSIKLWRPASSGWSPMTYRGHTGSVLSVNLGQEGRLLASSDADGAIKLWDATQDPQAATLGLPGVVARGLAFSPDGTRLASAGSDNVVRIFDARTRESLLALKGHTAAVLAVAFHPEGRFLASASADTTVRIWDLTSGHLLHKLKGHRNDVCAVAFSPDGRLLASASTDTTVRLWDLRTATLLHTFEGHTQEVTSIAFHPDGTRLASGSRDRTVRIWDVADSRPARTIRTKSGLVLGVAYNPQGTRLALAGSDGSIVIWDPASGDQVATLEGHTRPVSALAFNPDGLRLASASWDHTVRLWDLPASQEILTLRVHTGEVRSLAFSPDRWRIASGGSEGQIRIFDASPTKTDSAPKKP